MKISSVKLLNAATATGPGEAHNLFRGEKSFQLTGQTSAGAGSATVTVEVCDQDVPVNWITMCTITLALTTATSTDGSTSNAPWRWVRGNVTAISGTGAAVTLWNGSRGD